MATKGCESTAHHRSSISMLQERFRQLQRAKEMRKEKELLRLFSEPEARAGNPSSAHNYEPTGLYFRSSEQLRPGLSPLYRNPNLQAKQFGEAGAVFASTGSAGSASSYNMGYYNLDDNSDVDTSLHL